MGVGFGNEGARAPDDVGMHHHSPDVDLDFEIVFEFLIQSGVFDHFDRHGLATTAVFAHIDSCKTPGANPFGLPRSSHPAIIRRRTREKERETRDESGTAHRPAAGGQIAAARVVPQQAARSFARA